MPLTEEDKQAMQQQINAALAAATGRNGPQAQPVQQPAPMMMPAQPMGGMMPAAAMMPQYQQMPQMVPAAQMAPMGGQAPQPTAVLFRAKVPMPDGREVPVYLQFGPDVLQNLPMFAQMLMQVYPIDAYQPRQQNGWGGQNRGSWGNGGGNGGGWNGNRGGNGYGRRW